MKDKLPSEVISNSVEGADALQTLKYSLERYFRARRGKGKPFTFGYSCPYVPP